MGIFGRDEKTTPQASAQPAPKPAQAQRQAVTPNQVANDRSVLARSCNFEGVLRTSGDVTIEGRLTGEVHSTGVIIVAETGRVEANVHGKSVSVAGTLKGDVQADERIELEPSANVHGNIVAPRILIKDGATFEGQVFMKNPTKPSATAEQPKKGSNAGSGGNDGGGGGGSNKGNRGNGRKNG